MKTILNIFKSAFRVLFWIIILWVIILWIVLLVWWFPWKSYNLTKKYLSIWDYSIWKQQYYYNICHKKEWCLNWEILWTNQNWNNIYIYIKINTWSWYTINKDNQKITFFSYEFFKNSNRNYVENNIDLPKYWYLSDDKLEFYSENDLKNLSQEMQDIFKELEKNPTIIIDWIQYN